MSLAVTTAALAVAGCGGSSKKTTTAAGRPPAIPTSAFQATRTGTSTTAAKTSSTSAKTTKSATHAPAPAGHPHKKVEPAKPAPLGPMLTASAMASKANAACASFKSKANGLSKPGNFSSSASAAAPYLSKLVALDLSEVNALRLNPPRAAQLNYAHFYGYVLHHHLLLTIASNEAMSKKSDYASYYNQASSFQSSTMNPVARQLHFTSCVS